MTTNHPRPGVVWTVHQARASARQLLATAAITDADLTLLRFGNNAVFQVGHEYVLRVARPETPVEHVRQEVATATALAARDVPVAPLAVLPVMQPLTTGDAVGTVWEYVPAAGHVSHAQLGGLLRAFHDRTDSLDVAVPRWEPLASARRRLDTLAGQYPDEDIDLLERWYQRIQEQLTGLQPILLPGVIHGQAEIGNVLLRDGRPVFADLERVALGPREWDLVDTAAALMRFGLPPNRYRAFVDAYGFDVMKWQGFATLRRVWELRATTWLMQAGNHDATTADEIEVRLATWRENDASRQWRGF